MSEGEKDTDKYDNLILDLTQKEFDDEIQRFRNIKSRAADFVQISLVVAGVLGTVLSGILGAHILLSEFQRALIGLGLSLLIISAVVSLVAIIPQRLKTLDTATFDKKHRDNPSAERMDYLIGTLADLVKKAQVETNKLARLQLISYCFLTSGIVAIFITLLTFVS